VNYQDYLLNSQLSFLSKLLYDFGAVSVPKFIQTLQLNLHESELRQQIRKSYKSLINWGEKTLTIRLLNSRNIKKEDIEEFRQLHIQVAKRETRSQETWDIQYEQVLHNEAFVILGELEEELVTAAFFVHSKKCCYYGASASKRELFDKPLSHYVLWRAILHAKGLGCRFFEMGEQFYSKNQEPFHSQKELGISLFKSGFGGQTDVRLYLSI
jgi:FemAB family protein